MQTIPMPDARTLATLVSNVTQTMCGISFAPAEPNEKTPDMLWRVATLPITGVRPLQVALSSTQESCRALGAALFSCTPESLDNSMIDDSLCELLNMAAGQIKSALALDQALGLPKITGIEDLGDDSRRAMDGGLVLRSRGEVNLLIWISEGR